MVSSTHWRLLDWGILWLPVGALLIAYRLPSATKLALGFDYTAPTVLTAYTGHLIHLEGIHLLGNLLAYTLTAGTLYWLCRVARRRSFWLAWMVTYLIVFPPALAALNLAIQRAAIGIGFSGLVTALLGALPVGIALVVQREFAGAVRLAPAAFVPTLWVIVAVGLPWGRTTAVGAGVLAVLTGLYGLGLWHRRQHRFELWAVLCTRQHREPIILAVTLLLVYPLVIFSGGVTDTGVVPNHYVHLLGYCLGFLVAFIAGLVFVRNDR